MTTRYFFFVLLAFGFAGSVWAAPFTGTFTKITSTDDLTTGYYVIVGSESSAENADYAMSCEIDNNNRVKVSYISITDGNTITDPSDEVVYYITKKGVI